MAALINGNTISLTGIVGGLPDEGFTSDDVIAALATIGSDKDIIVKLNSGGGCAFSGSAVHSILSSHKGCVAIEVQGIAASAASLIALAGKTTRMAAGSVFMVHEVSGYTFGDIPAHERTIAALDRLGNAYAGIYASKTRKPAAKMRELMKAETWMTGEEAVAAGFVDSYGAEGETTAPAPFAYAAYSHAPQKLVALARHNGWVPRMSVGAAIRPAPESGRVVMAETPEIRERAARICEATVAAGVPGLASRLIRSHCTLDEAKARIRAATDGINGPNVKSFDAFAGRGK
jgi:ATP-dependent Clp protease, protease subunit